jgi:hypothetical protein
MASLGAVCRHQRWGAAVALAALALLTGCPVSGTVAVVLSTAVPDEPVVELIPGAPVVIAVDGVLHASVSGAFESYAWFLDGALIAGAGGSAVDIEGSSLVPGVHVLAVGVRHGGREYSRTLRFRVANEAD